MPAWRFLDRVAIALHDICTCRKSQSLSLAQRFSICRGERNREFRKEKVHSHELYKYRYFESPPYLDYSWRATYSIRITNDPLFFCYGYRYYIYLWASFRRSLSCKQIPSQSHFQYPIYTLPCIDPTILSKKEKGG